VNLAYELALAKQMKCILMELSLRMGVLASQLDIQPRYTMSDLLLNKDVDSGTVNQALTLIEENFWVLPGPYQSIEPGAIKPQEVLRLIDLASRLAEVVVLDVPCTFDDLYFKSLTAADSVVLVTQQKVASIRGAQLVCAALPDLPMHVVVNRYDRKLPGLTADNLRTLLKCPELSTIADDRAVSVAGDQGKLLRKQAPRSRALADIVALMESLAPEDHHSEQRAADSSILGRLGRAFSTLTKV
jgi:pilus assembly protein CpaE